MSMTRKDYKAIAAAVANAKAIAALPIDQAGGAEQALLVLAQAIADHCVADNPRFDRAKFLEACGVTSGSDE